MNSIIFLIFGFLCTFAIEENLKEGYGPDNVTQHVGYITIPGTRGDNGVHLWYWFFEARHNPETAPIILWMTGGPGCSSLVALFFENGPYHINPDLSLSINPYSWNEIANVMWIDQPVGTGYSYADSPLDMVTSEEEMAEDMYQFLQAFYNLYPKYRSLPFFIFGESYAGHYVPALAARVVKGNQDGGAKINLVSVAIGNGWTDPYSQYGVYADFLYDNNLLDSVSKVTYDDVLYPACEALIDIQQWFSAFYECNLAMETVLLDAEVQAEHTINVYDIRKRCDVEPLCYDFSLADQFLVKPDVITALNVTGEDWTDCATGVHLLLLDDWVESFAFDVALVLANNIQVYVYSGMADFVCNYYGGRAWTNGLSWPGQSAFNNAPLTNWTVNGQVAGHVKTAKGFTLIEVENAGHMVPMDQPENALDMVKRILSNQPF